MSLSARLGEWQDRQNGLRRVALVIAPVAAVILALAVGAIALWEWSHVHGRPVERARVVSAERTGHSQGCGKAGRADVYRLTWRSQDPPRGLDATFTNEEGCDRSEVGDERDVVRVVSDSGAVHVWDDPVTSLPWALLLVGVGFAGGHALGLLGGAVQWFWIGLRNRRARHARLTDRT